MLQQAEGAVLLRLGVGEHGVAQVTEAGLELGALGVHGLHLFEQALGFGLLADAGVGLGIAARGVLAYGRVDDDLFSDLVADQLVDHLAEVAGPLARRGGVEAGQELFGLTVVGLE